MTSLLGCSDVIVPTQVILLKLVTGSGDDTTTSYLYLVEARCVRFPSTVTSVTQTTPLHEVSAGGTAVRLDNIHSLQVSQSSGRAVRYFMIG